MRIIQRHRQVSGVKIAGKNVILIRKSFFHALNLINMVGTGRIDIYFLEKHKIRVLLFHRLDHTISRSKHCLLRNRRAAFSLQFLMVEDTVIIAAK